MRVVFDNLVENDERRGQLIDKLLEGIKNNQHDFDIITLNYDETISKLSSDRIKKIFSLYDPDLYFGIKFNYYKELPLEHSILLYSQKCYNLSDKIIMQLQKYIPEQKHYNLTKRDYATSKTNIHKKNTIIFMPGFTNNEAYLDKLENSDYLNRLAEAIIKGLS